MTPAQVRNIIGKLVTVRNDRFNEQFDMIIDAIDTKRRTCRSLDGGVFDYSELKLVK